MSIKEGKTPAYLRVDQLLRDQIMGRPWDTSEQEGELYQQTEEAILALLRPEQGWKKVGFRMRFPSTIFGVKDQECKLEYLVQSYNPPAPEPEGNVDLRAIVNPDINLRVHGSGESDPIFTTGIIDPEPNIGPFYSYEATLRAGARVYAASLDITPAFFYSLMELNYRKVVDPTTLVLTLNLIDLGHRTIHDANHTYKYGISHRNRLLETLAKIQGELSQIDPDVLVEKRDEDIRKAKSFRLFI